MVRKILMISACVVQPCAPLWTFNVPPIHIPQGGICLYSPDVSQHRCVWHRRCQWDVSTTSALYAEEASALTDTQSTMSRIIMN